MCYYYYDSRRGELYQVYTFNESKTYFVFHDIARLLAFMQPVCGDLESMLGLLELANGAVLLSQST